MNYDAILSKIFLVDDWHFNKKNVSKYKTSRRLKNKLQNIVLYVENRFPDSLSFKETIYRMNNKIEKRPVCKKCGNPVDFVGKANIIFKQYCSLSCSNSSPESIKKKQESDRAKNNGKLGWNKSSEEKINHRKETLISKYGDWKTACKAIEQKRLSGVMKKYGTDNIMLVPEIQMKRNTTLISKYHDNVLLNIPEIQLKRNNTLKYKRQFMKSKMEDDAYKILIDCFSTEDVVRQYSSEQYHWLCDFYIKSIDLYIECHFSQFHNSRPYTGNEADKNEIKLLKEKSNIVKQKYHKEKTQYDNIIYTWSDLDVRKLNTFKSNNLNYIIAYSLDELRTQLNKYKK